MSDRPSRRLGPNPVRLADLAQQLADVDLRWLDRKPLGPRPAQDEQILGQPLQPVGLLGRAPERLLQLLAGTRPRQRQVQFGLQHGQRRAELVAGLIEEAPVPRGRLVDSIEHRIQG